MGGDGGILRGGKPKLLLIHGGLWEDIGADWFWRRPGILAGFERLGFTVVAPDRLRRPASWAADAEHVLAGLAWLPVRRHQDARQPGQARRAGPGP
jgi:hypothetical protein